MEQQRCLHLILTGGTGLTREQACARRGNQSRENGGGESPAAATNPSPTKCRVPPRQSASPCVGRRQKHVSYSKLLGKFSVRHTLPDFGALPQGGSLLPYLGNRHSSCP